MPKYTNMLVYFALGDTKVWRWGSKPTPVPKANGFALQWNIGLTVTMMSNLSRPGVYMENSLWGGCGRCILTGEVAGGRGAPPGNLQKLTTISCNLGHSE